MIFAREDTILKAIEVTRKASFGRVPTQKKEPIYTRKDWAIECQKIGDILHHVLRDVRDGNTDSLIDRTKQMGNYHRLDPEPEV